MNWVSVRDGLPTAAGKYLMHSHSADPDMPGWQLMVAAFIPGITHWAALTPPTAGETRD